MRKSDASELYGYYLDAYIIERTGRTCKQLMQEADYTFRQRLGQVAEVGRRRAVELSTEHFVEEEPERSQRIAIQISSMALKAADLMATLGGHTVRID